MSKLEKVNYNTYENKSDKIYEEGQQKIRELLELQDENNKILICDPRHIFARIQIGPLFTIEKVDWQSLDFTGMLLSGNELGEFNIINQIYKAGDQFSYYQNRTHYDLTKYKYNIAGTSYATKYNVPLVVIEGVYDASSKAYDYIARGIISTTKDTVKIAISPYYEHKKDKPKILEKQNFNEII